MSVNPIAPASTAGAGMYESQSAALGKDDFLTLLLTQLQNFKVGARGTQADDVMGAKMRPFSICKAQLKLPQ